METKIYVVREGDKNYPEKLSYFSHKPKELYYIGKLPDEKCASAAIIGARACSNYGRKMASDIGQTLSEAGVQVISGMARGIDTYGMLGALKGGAPVFAILGCGVDICYPAENIEIYHEIIEKGGGIISEYPPGTKPYAWHFPMRNRIISGLSDIIIVVEAKENSGSLITAEWALEQGKDIYAVPGRVGEQLSLGCNRLIKTGAGIVSSTDDLLEAFQIQKNVFTKREINHLSGDLKKIFESLESQPKSLNEITMETKMNYGATLAVLLELQRMGVVCQPMENYYAKV